MMSKPKQMLVIETADISDSEQPEARMTDPITIKT